VITGVAGDSPSTKMNWRRMGKKRGKELFPNGQRDAVRSERMTKERWKIELNKYINIEWIGWCGTT